jgi:hypothetical protein
LRFRRGPSTSSHRSQMGGCALDDGRNMHIHVRMLSLLGTYPQHGEGGFRSGHYQRHELQCRLCHCSWANHHNFSDQQFTIQPSAWNVLLLGHQRNNRVDEQHYAAKSIQYTVDSDARDNVYHILGADNFILCCFVEQYSLTTAKHGINSRRPASKPETQSADKHTRLDQQCCRINSVIDIRRTLYATHQCSV